MLSDGEGRDSLADGIGFSLSVETYTDLEAQMARSRLAKGDGFVVECEAQNRSLEGDAAGQTLYLNQLVRPLFGSTPRAARAGEVPAGSDARSSRATVDDIVTSATNFPDSVTIFGWASTSNTDAAASQRPLFSPSGNLIKRVRDWRTSVHWPYDMNFMRFYSIAPAFEVIDMTVSKDADFFTPPSFTYTVPDDISRQRDILFGRSEADVAVHQTEKTSEQQRNEGLAKDDKTVKLHYSHILTAVRFARGTLPKDFRVTHIRLENIANAGTYKQTLGTWAWELDKTDLGETKRTGHYDLPVDYKSQAFNAEDELKTGETYVYIDAGQVLFLMPHECSDAARLIVTIEDAEGKEHTVSTKLTGDKWQPGHLVTYLLSLQTLKSDYKLKVTSSGDLVEESNSEQTIGVFNVDSYASVLTYNSETPEEGSGGKVDISVAGYSETGEEDDFTLDEHKIPSWIHIGPITTDDATETAYEINYQFDPQQYDNKLNHTTRLKETNGRQTINLAARNPNGKPFTSNPDDRATANCYIVNREGSYMFPMVYGNGLYIDGTNHPAKRDYSGNELFLDYRGEVIKKPWITEQLTSTPTVSGDVTTQTLYECQAKLLWQDAPLLVSNVHIDAEASDHIAFDVDMDHIRPGNALIALQGRKVTKKTTVLSSTTSATGVVGINESEKPETSADGLTTTTRYKETTYADGKYRQDYKEEVITRTTLDYENIWAWHIWVTDEIYPNDDEDASVTKLISLSSTEQIMPVNLGWVPNKQDWGVYNHREAWVKFRQNFSGKTLTLKFTQYARPDLPTGRSMLYQWGRPTPLPMLKENATDTASTVKFYDESGAEITGSALTTLFGIKTGNTLSTALTNPTHVISDWLPADALWRASEKTLYDPCPAGFRMPDISHFSCIANTPSTVTDGSNLNIFPDGENSSYEAVKNGEKNRGGYFFTAPHLTWDTSSLTDRYGTNETTGKAYTYIPNPSMFYLPASGLTIGDWELSYTSDAYLWSGDGAKFLRVVPDRTATGNVAEWPTSAYGGFAMPIRPTGNTLGE